jgi:tetratricopeptide (TPR) repeat protein
MLLRIARIVLIAATFTVPAYAAGGGGGGGGFSSAPSDSTPQYDPAVEYAKGADALKAGDYKAADKAFRKVLAVTPKDANALYMSGLAKAGDGDLKGAAKAYEKALKVDPAMLTARRDYAVTLYKLGEADKAAAELATLKTQAATCGDACPQAADLKSAVAAVEAAQTTGKTAALAPPPSLLFADAAAGDGAYLHAVSLINEHRYAEALVALDAAKAAFGPHPDVLTYIGFTYRKLGQYDRAEGYYRAALAIAPAHRGATEYYGELKAERGDIAGARTMLAALEAQCNFGCIEAEDLRRWIDAKGA